MVLWQLIGKAYRATGRFFLGFGKNRAVRFMLLPLIILGVTAAFGYFFLPKPVVVAPAETPYRYRPLAELKRDIPNRDTYFSGDYEAISASKPIEVTLPTNINQTRLSLSNAHPNLPNTGGFETSIDSSEKGLIAKAVPQSARAKAGLYKLRTTDPLTSQIVSDQTVAWGVLVFNPDYAIYPAGLKAKLAMAVLDDRGKMICDADLTLTITAPNGQIETLSTDNNRILVNEACFVYGRTQQPDYLAEYQPTEDGDYQVTLVARVGNGVRTLRDHFAVAKNDPFYLQRLGPSRTFPPATYPYSLSFQPKVGGRYQVTETVPASFTISDTTAKVVTKGDVQTLTWQVDVRGRQPVVLPFTFKTPNISPFLFELGPVTITAPNSLTWTEPRAWVIASDNACQSLATGNWSASGSWQTCGGTIPQAADTVTILNGHTITENTASVTVAGLTINTGGILTVSTTNAITVSGNWSNSGTFNAATGTVTFSSTATGKTLTGTLTGSSAFYNLVFNGAGGDWSVAAMAVGNDLTVTNGRVYTNNNAVTVTRDFTLANTGGVGYIPGTATTTVSRHWSDVGYKYDYGSIGTVVLNGTGNVYGVFNSLSVAYSGQTTTFVTGSTDLRNNGTAGGTLTTNGGVVTATGISVTTHCGATCTAVTVGSGTTFTGTGNGFNMVASANSITVNTAGADYGTWNIAMLENVHTNVTHALTGNITTTAGLNLYVATANTGCVFNTNNFSITAAKFTWGNSGNAGPCTLNLGSSTLTLVSGIGNLALGTNNNSGAYTLNMSTAQITTNGHITFVDGTGTVTTSPGTSTVTWNNTSGTANFTPNGQSLYNVVLNGSGGTVQPQAAMVITNDLTMTAGTINGTQNITVNGNVAGTAGLFNLSGGTFTQRVSASKNFGTTSGATAWIFNGLTFSNSNAGATPVTITTQTGGTGGITVSAGGNLLVGASGDAAGATTTLDAGNRTWTLQGTGGNPFQLLASPAAGFTAATSTIIINGANAGGSTIQSTTYNNLTIGKSPVCSTSTFNFGGAITVTGTTTVQSCGVFDTTAANNYALTTGKIVLTGTLTANNSTITLTGTTSTLFTKTGTFTQGDSTVIVTSPSGSPTLLSAATTFHILTINSAATIINAGQNITTDNDAGNKLYVQAGVFNLENRTVTPGTSGTLQVDSGATLCLGGTTGSTTATCDSGATQTTTSTFPAFTTVTLNSASTVIYLGDVAQTVLETPIYGNLNLTPKMTASRIYTMGGALTINGNFTIKPKASVGSTALTVNLAGTTTVAATKTTTVQPDATNSPTATLDATATNFNLSSGLVDIEAGGTLNIRNATLTVTGTAGTLFTRVGTFTVGGSSTTIFNGNGSPSALTSNNTVTFDALSLTPTLSGGAKTYAFGSGALTINGNFDIKPTAGTGGQSLTVTMGANITVASTGTTTLQPNVISSATAKLDATASNFNLSTGLLNVTNSGGGATLDVRNSTLTLTGTSGTIFTKIGTFTVGGSSTTIFNGDGSATALTSNNALTFDTLQLTPALSASRTYTFGSSALTINGNFDIKPTATTGSTILTVNMGADITVAATKATTIQPGATNSPAAVLDTRPAAADYNLTTGDLNLESNGKLEATGSASVITIVGNYVNNGTFTAGSSTATFTATAIGKTLSGTLNGTSAFYNLIFNGSGGGWTASAALVVSNDLTVTLGTLSGTNDLTVNGGDFTGDGVVNLTGGTVTITGTGSLGGATAWTFANLAIGTGVTQAVTSAAGSGGITVSAVLGITQKFAGGANELKAGSKTWTLSGGNSCPFYSCAIVALAGTTFTPETSTFTYTGSNGGGNVGVTNKPFYNLIINNGAETFDLGSNTAATNALTVTAGTLDATTANYPLSLSGNYTNSGTFTARNGTVTLDGVATQTLSGNLTGSSAFYNLTVTNSSGAVSGCSSSFTPGVSFGAAATVTNNFTAVTANTKIRYNSGSTYTFTNINWNGQATGTKIYFRNSNLSSGTWLLSVSGTQTAVSYVDVGRSDAASGSAINATDGTNNDCANNTNWNFSLPNAAANLAQKKTDNTVISTGGWTNETSVKFTADISDGDNPASIQLCIEKKALGVSFSDTEDACGSSVAYTGLAVATSLTIGSLTDTNEYHWQARVKDSGGAYSAWVSYDVNAESARDFGVDTTACTTATVYDGTTIGVDAAYSSAALDTLSANWAGFGCTVSGLNFYEYSIGTTSGGTDVTNWTNNGTATAVTKTGLILQTNQIYFFNVRATDTTGSLSSVSSSNGQTVLPQLSFSLSSNSIIFDTLGQGNNYSDTKTTTLTTSTNAYGGYVIAQYLSGLLNNGSATIPLFAAGSYATPASWPAGSCSGSTCGFGYTSDDPTIEGVNKFGGASLFAPYTLSVTGDIVADHTVTVNGASGAVSNESFVITHKVATDYLQPPGNYQATIFYIVTGSF